MPYHGVDEAELASALNARPQASAPILLLAKHLTGSASSYGISLRSKLLSPRCQGSICQLRGLPTLQPSPRQLWGPQLRSDITSVVI